MANPKKKPLASALKGLSPANPLTSTPEPTVAPVAPQASSPAPQKPAAAKKKESFYATDALRTRVRNTHLHVLTTEDGAPSLSDFLSNAVEREIERLEAKYNGGNPFPDAGPVPKGPPLSR